MQLFKLNKQNSARTLVTILDPRTSEPVSYDITDLTVNQAFNFPLDTEYRDLVLWSMDDPSPEEFIHEYIKRLGPEQSGWQLKKALDKFKMENTQE